MRRDLDAVLARGRTMAEERMRSRGTVRRRDGHTIVNDARVYTWSTVGADILVRLDGTRGSEQSSADTIGSSTTQVAHLEAHVPVGTPLRAGDLIDITSGEAAPCVLRVISAVHRDQATALRARVEVVPRPKEWTP